MKLFTKAIKDRERVEVSDTVYMVLDYETFSECDLKACGAWEYSVHPTTEILCAAYRIGTRKELASAETKLVLPCGGEGFAEFYGALCNPRIKLVAHNALFEQVITKNVYAKRWMYKTPELQKIPVSRWICTAALAASVGVPRHLDGASEALALKHKKDMEGHKLMLKLCKPRKPSLNNPSTRWDDIDDYAALYHYCMADIAAEVELFLKLPPLHPLEREFWKLDQRMNLRGFAVDRTLVKNAITLSEIVNRDLEKELRLLTNNELNSTRQVAKTLDLLKEEDLRLDNLQLATVEETLKRKNLTPKARRILEIRRSSSRSSIAKYQAFEIRSRYDGRARDNTLFYGAHTGRQSGTGLQPQNLFKRIISQNEVETAIGLINAGGSEILNYTRPGDVLASCVRSAIVASEGMTLDVGDFATIEVRVLFWLCNHQKGLADLKAGKDLYLDQAARIYEEDLNDLIKKHKAGDDSANKKRQLGKQTVLGAGFGIGLGGEKFLLAAKSYGLNISLSLAQKAIKSYRDLHAPVPHFWNTIEEAALKAMQEPGSAFKHGYLTWKKEKDWLTVKLPLGRKLYYYQPELTRVRGLYGENTVLTYLGVNSVTKKFERHKTWGGKLTENVVQAVARDILMEALWRIESRKLGRPVLAVHDEIVVERPLAPDTHKEFLKAMAEVPSWCKGLPIKVAGWSATRYRK